SASMPAGIEQHTATPIGTKGLVLIAGGVTNGTPVPTSRLYDLTGGNACTTSSQCATGFCVSGVCCDTACTDQCTSCTLPGSVGICSVKPNGTTCSDGNACTNGETCQSGLCAAKAPISCTTDQC